jgi:hypothetical protein
MPRSIGGRYDGPKDAALQPINMDTRMLDLSFGLIAAARGVSSPLLLY